MKRFILPILLLSPAFAIFIIKIVVPVLYIAYIFSGVAGLFTLLLSFALTVISLVGLILLIRRF